MGFRALVVRQKDGGPVTGAVEEVADDALPADGEVLVAVEYSGVNYKDGMCMAGLGRLVRDYPHIPGIDMAGTVIDSADKRYKKGDSVILTGWRYGEIWWGGYAERTRVKADWLVPMPKGLTSRQAMAIGTAGLTAILAVTALEDHGVAPDSGEVLVTGAAGGVGSHAVAILANRGYRVAAVTGRAETADYLKGLGAETVVPRGELSEPSGKPMESTRWAGCVENVGGTTLARVLGQMAYGGSVAAIGNASGVEFSANVLPFILRGVNLLGIDSVMQPYGRRVDCWGKAAGWIPLEKLDEMVVEAPLGDLMELSGRILEGRIKGRVVINPSL